MFNLHQTKQNVGCKILVRLFYSHSSSLSNRFNLYQRRKHERSITPEELFIENCAMVVDCPMKYNNLVPLNEKGDGTRFCNICQKNVYRTDSLATLRELTKKGQCVSFFVQQKNINLTPQERTGCFVL